MSGNSTGCARINCIFRLYFWIYRRTSLQDLRMTKAYYCIATLTERSRSCSRFPSALLHIRVLASVYLESTTYSGKPRRNNAIEVRRVYVAFATADRA